MCIYIIICIYIYIYTHVYYINPWAMKPPDMTVPAGFVWRLSSSCSRTRTGWSQSPSDWSWPWGSWSSQLQIEILKQLRGGLYMFTIGKLTDCCGKWLCLIGKSSINDYQWSVFHSRLLDYQRISNPSFWVSTCFSCFQALEELLRVEDVQTQWCHISISIFLDGVLDESIRKLYSLSLFWVYTSSAKKNRIIQ